MNYKNVYPKTIESAAEIVIDALSKEDLAIIKKMDEKYVNGIHMSLGDEIQHSMGLQDGNKELLKSCGSEEMHPQDASAAIVKFLWLKLRYEI